MQSDDVVPALERLLERYLRDNPRACDTAEGIAQWWLAPAGPVDAGALMQALQQLQARGAIEALQAADGRVRYRRAAAPPARTADGPSAVRDKPSTH